MNHRHSRPMATPTRHNQPQHPAQDSALEQRQQVAQSFAQQCEHILRSQFGAEQVILFGSLAEPRRWHQQSDLDLAVSGLSYPDWLQACDALGTIAPSWLKLDLIRLETVRPEVRARILREKPMPSNPYLALKEQLKDELMALERNTQALEAALERAKLNLDDYDIRAVASYINDIYRRYERMSERVAVTLDGSLPQGHNWHQALLRQVADEGREGRPALGSGSFLLDLDEYRKFRHIVHHKYGDELRADAVIALAALAPAMRTQAQRAIAHFNEWLTQQAALQ